MTLTVKPVDDLPLAGFSKGKSYPVLGYTGSTAIVLNDEKKLSHVSYAALNNEALWACDDSAKKDADKASADKVAQAKATLAAAEQASTQTATS